MGNICFVFSALKKKKAGNICLALLICFHDSFWVKMVSSCRAVVHGLLFPTWKSSHIPVYIFRWIHRMQRTLLQHSSALSQPKPIQRWTPIKGVQLIIGVTAGETSIWSDESHTQCFLGGDSKQSIMLQTMAVQHGRRA